MKVILSHPYCGPLYWWFEQERSHAMSKRPQHSYYRALFSDVDRHLDVALTCALVYQDFVIPAADAIYPGISELSYLSATALGLEISPWDPIHEASKLVEGVGESWRDDPVLTELLAGRDAAEISLELHYAVADVLLVKEYQCPIICSDGRRAVVKRLLDLGVAPTPSEPAVVRTEQKPVGELVDTYARITGLTFGVDRVEQFVNLKWTDPVRGYADSFQTMLSTPGVATVDDLYAAIAKAMEAQDLAEKVQGTFEATGRVMDVLGLIPGVGTITGLVGLGTDAGELAAGAAAARSKWLELSQAVTGARSRLALEAELRARGLR